MIELETRELGYFVVLAEELHFGRAAIRLSIAQPALSKAIRRVESRLGVQLLVRSSRHVALTPAGEALLRQGRVALDAVRAAVRDARQAGHLRLVLKPGGDAGLLSGLLSAYATRPDARRVDILFSGPADRADHLRDGRADVGLLYVPFDDLDGLAHETLHQEGRVAILPGGHRLAGRPEVRLADLAGEAFPSWPGTGGGPEVADVAQLMHLVAADRMIAVLPRSLVEPVPAGVVLVPVADAPPSRLVIAWLADDRRPLVRQFVEAAVATGRTGAGR